MKAMQSNLSPKLPASASQDDSDESDDYDEESESEFPVLEELVHRLNEYKSQKAAAIEQGLRFDEPRPTIPVAEADLLVMQIQASLAEDDTVLEEFGTMLFTHGYFSRALTIIVLYRRVLSDNADAIRLN